MEPNLPVKARKFWHMVRAAIFMLRKSISESKIIADLNMMMKLGKVTGKAIQNLMFHHWASSSAASRRPDDNRSHQLPFTPRPDEYEFSCSGSPAYPSFHLPFHLNKRKKSHHHHHHHQQQQQRRRHSRKFSCDEAVPEEDEVAAANAVVKAFKMLQSETPSPALPGFGRSPYMVRQVRITDSPFPLRDVDEDTSVNEAAENFIQKFYKNLRRQNAIAWDNVDEKS